MQKPLWITYDGGYGDLKAVCGDERAILTHTVRAVNESEWAAMRETDPKSLDMIKVDGKPFAFGNTAIRKGFVKAKRAERYVPGYYDIQYFRMIVPFLARTNEVQRIFAGVSYPPEDHGYAKNLRGLIRGERLIELPDGTRFFIDTEHVMTYPEIGGGAANFKTSSLGDDGRRRRLMDQRSYLVDIGHGTTDICESPYGLVPTLESAESLDVGAGTIQAGFGRALRAKYPDLFRSGIREDILRNAFMDGKIRVGKGEYESLESMIEEEVNVFFTQLDNAVGQRGGWFSAGYIGFSGGGSDLMRKQVTARYGGSHEIVLLGKSGEMRWANVLGGQKLLYATGKEAKWR